MELESHTLQLMGVYRSIYNRLVRPDVTLPVRDYFLTRWAPQLGGDLSLLIIQLRRLCLTQDGQSVELSAAKLASLVGISERTLRRHLADSRLAPFIQRQHQWRYNPSVGHGVQAHNRYIVALDDPLTEEDEQLAMALAQDTDRPPRAEELSGLPVSLGTTRSAPATKPSTRSSRKAAAVPAPPTTVAARSQSDHGAPATGQNTMHEPLAGQPDRQEMSAGQYDHLSPTTRLEQQPATNEPVKLADTIRRIGFDRESIVSNAQQVASVQKRKRGPVDLLVERPDWREQVEHAEEVLGETGASRGFYVKVLRALEAQDAMNIWERALGLAREQDAASIRRSRGALFNTLVRRLAAEAGVTI